MRTLGYILLIGGFVWLAYDVAIGFTEDQYAIWIGYSKTKLPAGDPVPRRDVIGIMRELCLDLKNRHRFVIAPGVLMLAGGLLVGSRRPVGAGPLPPSNRSTEPPTDTSTRIPKASEGRR